MGHSTTNFKVIRYISFSRVGEQEQRLFNLRQTLYITD
ncbi:Uncharacterized protein FWK35_00030174 [Aphis craccivora]|uniref:Uncharacterized protein n=1 Tax=Aphis craccivora TaxID=307492 RepID=A0A6G0VN88_APHCR|nr:Uncharacterized protein FWK35_00030174 [Aphis craccivora]